MEFFLWFVVGFVAHRLFNAVKDHLQAPYRWICQEKNCGFRVRTDNPDTLSVIILTHQNSKHPEVVS